jgi:hypothetical protein
MGPRRRPKRCCHGLIRVGVTRVTTRLDTRLDTRTPQLAGVAEMRMAGPMAYEGVGGERVSWWRQEGERA